MKLKDEAKKFMKNKHILIFLAYIIVNTIFYIILPFGENNTIYHSIIRAITYATLPAVGLMIVKRYGYKSEYTKAIFFATIGAIIIFSGKIYTMAYTALNGFIGRTVFEDATFGIGILIGTIGVFYLLKTTPPKIDYKKMIYIAGVAIIIILPLTFIILKLLETSGLQLGKLGAITGIAIFMIVISIIITTTLKGVFSKVWIIATIGIILSMTEYLLFIILELPSTYIGVINAIDMMGTLLVTIAFNTYYNIMKTITTKEK